MEGSVQLHLNHSLEVIIEIFTTVKNWMIMVVILMTLIKGCMVMMVIMMPVMTMFKIVY